MNDQIQKAVEVLNQGGIVIFPTDTAFGVGCRIDNKASIKKLFEIRKRPLDKATPVLVNSVDMASNYLKEIPTNVLEKLIKPYWPGALTIVLKCQKDKVPSLVRGGGDTIGVRMPNHITTLEIIEKVGVPILGPSANFSGDKTPYFQKALNKEFIKLVDFVVSGECLLKEASTVINAANSPWQILRKGAIDINI